MTSNPTFLATGSSSLSLTSRGFSPSSSLSLGVRIPARLSPAEGCSDGPGGALSAPDAHPFSPSSLVSSCPLCAAGVPTPSGLGFAAEPSAPPPHRGRKGSSSARGVRRCIAGARGLPSASASPPPAPPPAPACDRRRDARQRGSPAGSGPLSSSWATFSPSTSVSSRPRKTAVPGILASLPLGPFQGHGPEQA